MKQKVFDYIEELERKAKESEKYFKLWHEEKVKNNKAIKYIEENEVVDYNPTLDGSEDDSYMKLPRSLSLFNEGLDILLDILKGVDKE